MERDYNDGIQARSDLKVVLQNYIKKWQNILPEIRICELCSDNAPEYIAGAVRDMCQVMGIVQDPSCPYTAEQNGRAERMNRHLLEKSVAIRSESKILVDKWPFIVRMAEFVINRLPCQTLGWKSPYELVFGKIPNYSAFRVPGCGASVCREETP